MSARRQKGTVAVYTNITEIKHAEEEIRAAKRQTRAGQRPRNGEEQGIGGLVYQIVEVSVATGILINILGLERGKNCIEPERN